MEEELTYSVLIASSSQKFNASIQQLLPVTRYNPIYYAEDIATATREWSQRTYNFVIINSPLKDNLGTQFAIQTASTRGTIVLLITPADTLASTTDLVLPHGVFTLAKPLTVPLLTTALAWMAAAFQRLHLTEIHTISIENKIDEMRLVNRAKWLLISELKMDEPHAHRYIEKQAMDLCISKRQVAEQIIRTYS